MVQPYQEDLPEFQSPSSIEDATRGKVNRNLHIWIALFVSLMAAGALYLKMSGNEQAAAVRQEQAKVQAQQDVQPAPQLAVIQGEAARQTEAGKAAEAANKRDADAKADALANTPAGAGGAASATIPGGENDKYAVPKSLLAPPSGKKGTQEYDYPGEKEKLQAYRSGITALDETGNVNSGSNGSSKGEGDSGIGGEIDALANALKSSPSGVQRPDLGTIISALNSQKELPPTSTAKANSEWLKSQKTADDSSGVITPILPRSPYTLYQYSVIPCVLVSPINSDLPGQITARVTEDIYDSVEFRHLLIPKGTTIGGTYNNEVNDGQERIMAAFNRLIFPSGASATLGGMSAADGRGASGLKDEVDTHFGKRFGTSFLIAGLARLVQNKSGGTTVLNFSGTQPSLGNEAGQIMVDISKQLLQKNTNIPPTIIINEGYRFNIMVNKDMTMDPSITGVVSRRRAH